MLYPVVLQVQLGDLLGQGAFGTTYKAYWRGAQVAVKQVLVRGETELLNFLREVECLAALRHPNVVPFLGAVLQVRIETAVCLHQLQAVGWSASIAWVLDHSNRVHADCLELAQACLNTSCN